MNYACEDSDQRAWLINSLGDRISREKINPRYTEIKEIKINMQNSIIELRNIANF